MDLKLILITGVFMLLLAACAPHVDSSLTSIEVGDCVKSPGFGNSGVRSLEHVDCSEEGTLEVLRTFDIDGYEEWLGDATITRVTDSGCPPRTNYVLSPNEDSWNIPEGRAVVCFQ